MTMRKMIPAAFAAALLMSTAAHASQFDFSFSDTGGLFNSGGTISGTGVLTSSQVGSPYTISSLTGTLTVNGVGYAMSLLSAGTQVWSTSTVDDVLQYPAPTGVSDPTYFDLSEHRV
jgi:hypothetical protein